MKLIGIFAAVCIFISCLGLFGLSAFTTEQRTKEIGIRKVLGSSTWQIIIMLARNIQLLVLGGAVVASLIAYYAMDEWLSDFAYRININKDSWVFLVAAVVAAAVAFFTVALQSFKTAQANPINALRYE
jgi:putative ABC transport system permease protein